MNEQLGTGESSARPHTILVYGDWVVDEYWFLVRHESDISSQTGFAQYRISTEPEEVIYALCGAGHAAHVLYSLRSDPRKSHLWGLGIWHRDDTAFLSHLVHCNVPNEPIPCKAAGMSFRLQPQICDKSIDQIGISLRNLEYSDRTIRVVRLYHQEGAHLEQSCRIDWEPKPQPLVDARSGQQSRYDLPKEGLPESVDLVVVEDYVKGAVTLELVDKLCQRYPNARWHVRTKDKTRKWLEKVKELLDLLVIGPEITSLRKPWRSWLSDDHLTAQALEMLSEMPEFKGCHLVILTDAREVIARLKGELRVITGRSNAERNPLADIGWPSAFFAAMSWYIHNKHEEPINKSAMEKLLGQADKYGSIKPPPSTGIRLTTPPVPTVYCAEWPVECETWDEARRKYGIITRQGRRYLDIWRASTNLPGYVTCIRKKQEVIDRIGRYIRNFTKRINPPTSLSIMLQADPGSGKTFLAQSLARAFECSYLHFDITQMMHREELHYIFDAIATQQAQNVRSGEYERSVLVFVDEINAKLDQDYTFGAFLAPLESCSYVRDGRNYCLRPCIWLFAGTEMKPDDSKPSDKISDFTSRITLNEQIDFNSLKKKYEEDPTLKAHLIASGNRGVQLLYEEARLEQVYVGVSMINQAFPDVRRVTKDVLCGFWKLDPEKSPSRILRRLATGFSNVQHGIITRGNWDNHYEEITKGYIAEFDLELWCPGKEGEELVELRFRAAESIESKDLSEKK